MVRFFIYSLLAILVGLAATYFLDLADDPGYLLIAWGNYTFETSLLALFFLLIAVTVFWQLLGLLLAWLNPLYLIRIGKSFRGRNRSRSKTIEGLLHFARSNWQLAYNQLLLGARDNDASVVNYLAAAFAANELKRQDQSMDCLDQALRQYPEAASTINTVKAGLLLKTDRLDQCAAVLDQLRKTALNDIHLLNMLKEVYLRLEDWNALRSLLPSLVKTEAVSADQLAQLEKRLFVEEFRALANTIKQEPKQGEQAVSEFRKRWKKLPQKFRDDERLVLLVSRALIDAGARAEAAGIVENYLGRFWSDSLMELYALTDFGNSSQQLVNGEIWLRERPRDVRLLLALGRICLRNRLWGKARDYFEASLRITPLAETCGELSRLTASLGDAAASTRYFNQYMELSGSSLPALPVPEPRK